MAKDGNTLRDRLEITAGGILVWLLFGGIIAVAASFLTWAWNLLRYAQLGNGYTPLSAIEALKHTWLAEWADHPNPGLASTS